MGAGHAQLLAHSLFANKQSSYTLHWTPQLSDSRSSDGKFIIGVCTLGTINKLKVLDWELARASYLENEFSWDRWLLR